MWRGAYVVNPKECLYCELNAFTRQFNRMCEQTFTQEAGLSLPHGNLLLLVLSRPGILSKDLSEELVLANSTITRFVDALQKRGLLRRQVSDSDGRAFRIYPTEKAESLHGQLRRARDNMKQVMQQRFSSDELAELQGLVHRSLQLVSQV